MRTIDIEGVQLTDGLIRFIKQCQADSDFMGAKLDTIDNAISIIACNSNLELGNEREALSAIADLSYLKRYIQLLDGKSMNNG